MDSKIFGLMRTLMRINQEELAQILKVSSRSVLRWEAGQWPVPPAAAETMETIFAAFVDRARARLDTSGPVTLAFQSGADARRVAAENAAALILAASQGRKIQATEVSEDQQ